MTPAPTTREAELARRREYEAEQKVLARESDAAVALKAEIDAKIRLMLTEGWF